jgi:murein DD-endopeptidase MepM/ murein hydrolase activator NlpD
MNSFAMDIGRALIVASAFAIPTTAAEKQTDVALKSSPAEIKFDWPAVGRIMFGFCKTPGHESKDMINIVVPASTNVHATEAGEIVYAGDELKGFHNLILIAHQDRWVSAYANNDEMLVKRRDTVERGQVIARIGSGYPNWLQFELRHHGAPVDPLLVLKGAGTDIAQAAEPQCRG